MTLAEALANRGTHFHRGEVVVYAIATGCTYEYTETDYCPNCMGAHVCGKACQ